MVIAELRRDIASRLDVAGVPDAAFDADQLVLKALSMSRTEMALCPDREVDESQLSSINVLVKKRIAGYPLQYILGEWEFYGRPFYVGEGVLIPRADTEILVDSAIGFLKNTDGVKENGGDVIDLCSGSGCIAISVATACPKARVTAVELYDEAYGYLLKNIERNGAKVNAVCADVLKKPENFGEYDLILTNPPYIERATVDTLSSEVKTEPITALDGGRDGLDFYRAIAENWVPLIREGGAIMAEIGEEQASAVTELFGKKGLDCKTVKDLNGLDRVIIGTRKVI